MKKEKISRDETKSLGKILVSGDVMCLQLLKVICLNRMRVWQETRMLSDLAALRRATDDTYSTIAKPPALPQQPRMVTDDFSVPFSQPGLHRSPPPNSGRHGESSSLSKSCFRPISRQSFAAL